MSTIDTGPAISAPSIRGPGAPLISSNDRPSTGAPAIAQRRRSVRYELKKFSKGMAFISPWLIGFLIFTLLPVALSLYYSFCDFTLLRRPVFRGFAKYHALLHDPVFWLSLSITFKYAGIALPAAMLVSLGLAMMLNSDIR